MTNSGRRGWPIIPFYKAEVPTSLILQWPAPPGIPNSVRLSQYATSIFTLPVQTKLAVDGKWVGVNKANNYFYFTLEPGPHYFCSQAENHNLLTLVVEAGKTYYLQQKIRAGWVKAQTDLQLLDEDEGKKGLAKCKRRVFEEKKKD